MEQAALAQDAPVVAGRRLGHVRERGRAVQVLAPRQALDDPEADRVAERSEDVGELDLRGFRGDAVAEYERNVQPILASYGGQVIARDEDPIIAEGTRRPHLAVLIKFADKAAFRRFYESDEYAPWKELRQRNATEDAVVLEGPDDLAA